MHVAVNPRKLQFCLCLPEPLFVVNNSLLQGPAAQTFSSMVKPFKFQTC